MLGFDCDNGSEFLNTTLENYLLNKTRNIKWTRSRPYKKNDQAHVEQKNFTHVRQLLGYGRYRNIELVELVNDLYENAWLPLRNNFSPVIKLIEKKRIGSKVTKKYDTAPPVTDYYNVQKSVTKSKRNSPKNEPNYDPIELAESIETKLQHSYKIIEEIEAQREEENQWLAEPSGIATDDTGSVSAPVASAPSASTPSEPSENPAKSPRNKQNQPITRVS